MTNGGSKGFIIEPQSPYYLHPLEGPRVLITIVVFNGKNYDIWEKDIQTSLKAKNTLGVIEGTLTRPAAKDGDDSEVQAWEMVNSMVSSWILNVINPKLHTSVASVDTAKLMWETLKKRHAVANILKIHQLKTSIANCKQGGLSVVEFYSKISDLWVELGNHEKVQCCTCKGCTCEAANRIVQMHEQEKALQFLMGLNDDTYSSIRS